MSFFYQPISIAILSFYLAFLCVRFFHMAHWFYDRYRTHTLTNTNIAIFILEHPVDGAFAFWQSFNSLNKTKKMCMICFRKWGHWNSVDWIRIWKMAFAENPFSIYISSLFTRFYRCLYRQPFFRIKKEENDFNPNDLINMLLTIINSFSNVFIYTVGLNSFSSLRYLSPYILLQLPRPNV